MVQSLQASGAQHPSNYLPSNAHSYIHVRIKCSTPSNCLAMPTHTYMYLTCSTPSNYLPSNAHSYIHVLKLLNTE